MFKILHEKGSDVVIVEAHGVIEKMDYDFILEPFFDELKEKNEKKKVKLIFQTADDFEGYTLDSAWEDFKFSIFNLLTFEKCAIVSDVTWLRNSCRIFAPFFPCPVMIFDQKDLAAAKNWVHAD